eukprot:SAG22_NODE_2854_length_2155_cov_2.038911_3_plen_216_part_00
MLAAAATLLLHSATLLGAARASLLPDLKDAAALWRGGMLSDEEYAAAKRVLLRAAPPPSPPPPAAAAQSGMVNVRDYGAIGDGVADDTAAIAAAIAAAGKAKSSRAYGCGSGCGVTGPEVVFPAGTYRTTSTLSPAGWMRGEGGAMIQQTNGSADIFATGPAGKMFDTAAGGNIWRLTVTGLFLHGGRHQFNLGASLQKAGAPVCPSDSPAPRPR